MAAVSDSKQPMVAIKNLVKSFGRVDAVNGVDLEVEQGKVVVIIGHPQKIFWVFRYPFL